MNHLTQGLSFGLVVVFATSCASPRLAVSPAEVVPFSKVDWQPLNPARGDASPRAGTLWGDRQGEGPTGFLVRFVDGFESPPHIHNVSYRGVVIRGLVHNDDPKAASMWMPTGSFWTQPKGHGHITAARGTGNLAYIEIDEGPYLVRPTEQAFEAGERPVNVDASNLVWSDAARVGWSDRESGSVAFLWGDPGGAGPGGVLLRLAAGETGAAHGRGGRFHAVVIRGQVRTPDRAEASEPGSYLHAASGAVPVTCAGDESCLVYVRADGSESVVSKRP